MSLYTGANREAMREAWRCAWQRHLARLPLEPLQAQMADLVAMHPEYHAQLALTAPAQSVGLEDSAQTANSFLHLALHMALREQLATQRPVGIVEVHRRLSVAAGETHAAEHCMIEVLAQTLWEAQRGGGAADEQRYLEALRKL